MTAVMLSIWGCNRYDDTDLWDKVDSLEERIARLEKLCNEMNTNISALENIVTALQNNDYVTDVTSIIESGKEIGFTITFSKSGRVVIYHGENGADGAAGAPGQDGADGADGKDGHTPVIGVKKDADGIYYWTLDGEWITDSEGNKIPTTGKDGEDGEDGKDGKPGTPGQDGEDGADGEQGQPGQDGEDGITPLLKIEDDYWYISYDNGQSWQQLYKAIGEDGKDGQNGAPGKDGEDGKSFFQSVDTTNPNYIILTLGDGSQIKIPTWKAFEELQTKVNQINTNLAALQTILEALQNSDYVIEITHLTAEDGSEIGYTIYFSKSQPVTIYHGKDGANGAPGQDGEDGEDGADGKDGYIPVISVKQGEDGNYYWTVDGEWMNSNNQGDDWVIEGGWLTDENGNRIPATGKDGVTPLLKIIDGNWYISYDNGKTWSTEPLGPATAGVEGDIFSDISYDDKYLYITLASGETVTISRHKDKLPDACNVSPINITDRSATFIGSLDIEKKDIPYSQIIIYYSDAKEFNIYTAESVTTTFFDYNSSFSIVLSGLKAGTKYSYCLCIKVRGEEVYGDIKDFKTEDEPTLETSFERGRLLENSGYYNETVHINGFALPLYKEDIPEKFDYVRFYLKGMRDDDTRFITVELGVFTSGDMTSNSFIPFKSVTLPVNLKSKYTPTDFPLECTRNEIEAAMRAYPESTYWGLAYYLSDEDIDDDVRMSEDEYNYSVGCGACNDERYNPISSLCLYRYQDKWSVNTGNLKQPFYVATITVVPPQK